MNHFNDGDGQLITIDDINGSSAKLLTISGRFDAADFDNVMVQLQATANQFGALRILCVVAAPEPSQRIWQDLQLAITGLFEVSHMAIVAGRHWTNATARPGDPSPSMQVCYFAAEQLDAARLWISAS